MRADTDATQPAVSDLTALEAQGSRPSFPWATTRPGSLIRPSIAGDRLLLFRSGRQPSCRPVPAAGRSPDLDRFLRVPQDGQYDLR